MKQIKLVAIIVVGSYIGWIIGGYITDRAFNNVPKRTYELEQVVFDSVGNEYHNIKQYDHVPTHNDSVEFYK